MTQGKKLELELEHKFDSSRYRHYLNDQLAVLHCHHYSTLYTQLALDAEFLDGKMLLAECAEDSFYKVLLGYFEAHTELDLADKLSVGCQYYGAVGLGQMEVMCAGEDSGEVVLHHSHLDEGWIKKWGQHDRPVNYITAGYIAALFSATYELPPRSYAVLETESIVTGAERSRFNAVRL